MGLSVTKIKPIEHFPLSYGITHFSTLSSCIDKWLQTCPKCPQCNAKAKRGDIRVLYSKAISVVDTTERDRALLELENERNTRILAQKTEAQAVLQYQLARAECDRLREEIKSLKKQLESFSSSVKCEGVECVGVSGDRQGKYEFCNSIVVSQVHYSYLPTLLKTGTNFSEF